MHSVVAVVETRPETVVEDYRRLLELARLPQIADDKSLLLVGRSAAGVTGGPGSPPWQPDGVLTWLQRQGIEPTRIEAAVDRSGAGLRPALVQGAAWRDVLAGHGLAADAAFASTRVRIHPQQPLPALAAVQRDGYSLPSSLLGRQLILLPVPALRAGWPVAGAVALLRDLILGPLPRLGKVPVAEVTAELLALVLEACPAPLAVMDAVVWDTADLRDPADAVLRNVLLASADPVALDAVATRLAGHDPRHSDWLRLCRQRGLGAGDFDRIRVVGRTEFLNLDFELDRAPFSGDLRRKVRSSARLGWWRRRRSGSGKETWLQSGWAELMADYASAAMHDGQDRKQAGS